MAPTLWYSPFLLIVWSFSLLAQVHPGAGTISIILSGSCFITDQSLWHSFTMSFLLQYFPVLIVSLKSEQQARNSGGISMVQSWDPIPSSENLSLCTYGLQLTGWGPSTKGRIICFTQVYLFKCCCLVAKLCLILFDLMDCSMPGSFVLHYLLEFAKIHVFWVSDVI